MDIPKINELLNDAKLSIDGALELINGVTPEPPQPEPPGITVKAGEALQPALDKAGTISLEAGATWEGTYVVRSNTILKGNGAHINGVSDAALIIRPGTSHVTIQDIVGNTKVDQRVFLIGHNDTTQTAIEQVPTDIHWLRCSVPTYRGKRGFEMNGTGSFRDCTVADLWDPALRDSQAIGISNTTGPVLVDGCHLTAGSEIIMVGGDKIKLPVGTVPTGLTIQNSTLSRPDSWRTDGVKRAVKNCFELKSGVDVLLKNVTLDGSWADAQVGCALLITPRNKNPVKNVTIDGVTIMNCTAMFSFMGQDNYEHTPYPVSNVVVKNCTGNVSKKNGGYGNVANCTAGLVDVTFDSNQFTVDAAYIFDYQHLNYMDANGVLSPAAKLGSLVFTNNKMNTATLYSFRFEGQNNGNKWQAAADACTVEGNTFPNAAPDLKRNFPTNTWV
jgi:hypothetical protein